MMTLSKERRSWAEFFGFEDAKWSPDAVHRKLVLNNRWRFNSLVKIQLLLIIL
jgi:hypothetical protein